MHGNQKKINLETARLFDEHIIKKDLENLTKRNWKEMMIWRVQKRVSIKERREKDRQIDRSRERSGNWGPFSFINDGKYKDTKLHDWKGTIRS